MTVKELIEKLKMMDQNADVLIFDGEFGAMSASDATFVAAGTMHRYEHHQYDACVIEP